MPRALYLSQDYLKAYARAVRIMARVGLRAALCDEYPGRSGHAGGRTVRGADHLRETHLSWIEATGPEEGRRTSTRFPGFSPMASPGQCIAFLPGMPEAG
jgi:hypothetical protein